MTRSKYTEPWFLSNDNGDETWVITDGVETFPIHLASPAEFGIAVRGTVERADLTAHNAALTEQIRVLEERLASSQRISLGAIFLADAVGAEVVEIAQRLYDASLTARVREETLTGLLADLRKSPIVTLAGKGGAYEYIEALSTPAEGGAVAAPASSAAFTCRLRITCVLCGHTVCGNPEHQAYAADPHEAMVVHKAVKHRTLANPGGN